MNEIEKSIQYDDRALSIFITLDRRQEIAEIIQNAKLLAEEVNDRKVLENKVVQLSEAYDETELQEILDLVTVKE